jgi:hypothetical protein
MNQGLATREVDIQGTELAKLIEQVEPLLETELLRLNRTAVAAEAAGEVAEMGQLEVGRERYLGMQSATMPAGEAISLQLALQSAGGALCILYDRSRTGHGQY